MTDVGRESGSPDLLPQQEVTLLSSPPDQDRSSPVNALIAAMDRWARIPADDHVAASWEAEPLLRRATTLLRDQQAEIARHHADFEQWEATAAKGAGKMNAISQAFMDLQFAISHTDEPETRTELRRIQRGLGAVMDWQSA